LGLQVARYFSLSLAGLQGIFFGRVAIADKPQRIAKHVPLFSGRTKHPEWGNEKL